MIKVPYLTLNLRKWRRENGLDTEAVEAYVKASAVQDAVFALVMWVTYFYLGYVVGSYVVGRT